MLSTWQWSRVTSDVCGTVLVGNDSVDVSEGEDGMSTNAESNMRPITRITVKIFAKKTKSFIFQKKTKKFFFFAKTKVFFLKIFFKKKAVVKGGCKIFLGLLFFQKFFFKCFFWVVFFFFLMVFCVFFVCFF